MVDAEVVVLGLGSVGAFAVDYLAENRVEVIGIERYGRGHNCGSHHGHTRIFRHAYFEHADYIPLLMHSTKEFRRLEREMNVPIINQCGVLIIGEKKLDKDVKPTLVDRAYESAKEYSIEVERMDRNEIASKFPFFDDTDKNTEALWEPGGGFVRPEASIRAALKRAEQNGAKILDDAKIMSWEEVDDHVHVNIKINGSSRILRAKALVSTLGAFTSKLVPSLGPYLKTTRQRSIWIKPNDPSMAYPDRFPCWIIDAGESPAPYGIPIDPLVTNGATIEDASSAHCIKVALHGSDDEVDPETYDCVLSQSDIKDLMNVAKKTLPNIVGTYKKGSACLYTMTPDGHFIVDKIPQCNRSWAVAGLSGHGFKMAPALGKVVSDLATTGRSVDFPCNFLSLSRLLKK